MKLLCPILLASVLSAVPSAPRSEPALDSWTRAPISRGEHGSTLMICHAVAPDGFRMRVRFKYEGEGKDAALSTPLLIDTDFNGETIREEWPQGSARFDFVDGGPEFIVRGHSDRGGTLWWRRHFVGRDNVDEADVHLPPRGNVPEIQLRLTGKPDSPENHPAGASGGCATIFNSPRD